MQPTTHDPRILEEVLQPRPCAPFKHVPKLDLSSLTREQDDLLAAGAAHLRSVLFDERYSPRARNIDDLFSLCAMTHVTAIHAIEALDQETERAVADEMFKRAGAYEKVLLAITPKGRNLLTSVAQSTARDIARRLAGVRFVDERAKLFLHARQDTLEF